MAETHKTPAELKAAELKAAELQPGDTFTRGGNSVTVHFIRAGEVYFDKHRTEESGQPFGFGRNGWGRLGLAEFVDGVAGADWTNAAVPQDSIGHPPQSVE